MRVVTGVLPEPPTEPDEPDEVAAARAGGHRRAAEPLDAEPDEPDESWLPLVRVVTGVLGRRSSRPPTSRPTRASRSCGWRRRSRRSARAAPRDPAACDPLAPVLGAPVPRARWPPVATAPRRDGNAGARTRARSRGPCGGSPACGTALRAIRAASVATGLSAGCSAYTRQPAGRDGGDRRRGSGMCPAHSDPPVRGRRHCGESTVSREPKQG